MNLKKQTKRMAALLIAMTVIVTSVPQEYLTVYAAEQIDADGNSETGEGARQETDAPETAEPSATTEPQEPEAENPVFETQTPVMTETETELPTAQEPPAEEKTEAESGTTAIATETAADDISEDISTEDITIEETTVDETLADEAAEETTEETTTESVEPKADILAEGTGYKNENVTWILYGDGKLEVSGSGEIVGGGGSGEVPWLWYTDKQGYTKTFSSEIKSVTIDVTGATTTAYMFNNCTNLKKVDLKNFKTENVTNMEHMFYNCSSLENLDLSDIDTSNVTNMSYMFCDCSSLSALNLDNFKTENVTNMSRMFSDCHSLTELKIDSFKTDKVTNMSYMFYCCWSLTALDLSGFRTGNVTDMSRMFETCRALTALDLSRFDTVNVTNMSGMFEDCYSLTELKIDSFNTENVTDMSSVFHGCSSLESLDLSSFCINDTANVYDFFSGCSNLKEIIQTWKVYNSVELPSTNGTCSWRDEDGNKVRFLQQKLTENTTLSTNRKFGITFEGTNFTLAEYSDKELEEIEEIVDAGAKDSYTFTIIPDDGYIIQSVTPKDTDTKITVTKGEKDEKGFRYTIAPDDAEQGYTRDEVILIKMAPKETFDLTMYYNGGESYIGDIVVINGTSVTENKPSSVQVSNEFDTVMFIKMKEEANEKNVRIPEIRLGNKDISHESDTASMSEKEKEYADKGYYVFRLGGIYSNTTAQITVKTMCRLKFTMSGFPGKVSIVQYKYNGFTYENESEYQQQEYTDEVLTGYQDDFYFQVKWEDTEDAACRWCQVDVNSAGRGNLSTTELGGIEGRIWVYRPIENSEILIDLNPYKIQLHYDESNIFDLTSDNKYITFSEEQEEYDSYPRKYINVSGGEKLTFSFYLEYGMEVKDLDTSLWELTTGDDGKSTVTLRDMSKLYEIYSINIEAYDPLNRISLSDPNNIVRVQASWSGKTYKKEPVEAKAVTVNLTYTDSSGRKNRAKLIENTDYTLSYSNNINAGEALMIITAVPGSPYRGSYVVPFTIDKADAPELKDKNLQLEYDAQQLTQKVNLSDFFAAQTIYDEKAVPTEYKMVRINKGAVLAEEPILEDSMLTYTIREGADKLSTPASIEFNVIFENYRDVRVTLKIQVVNKRMLTLGGGIVINDKTYDGMEFVPDPEGLKVLTKEGVPLSEQEAADILNEIKYSLSYHYTGIEGTVYDADTAPVDIGTYKVYVKVAEENLDYKSDYIDAGMFRITQRNTTIIADDVVLYLGDTLPELTQYTYRIEGLAEGDAVSTKSFVSCSIQSTATIAEYPITINIPAVRIGNMAGKDVTANYNITAQEGRLTVREPEPGSYTVVYTGLDPLDYWNPQKNITRSGYEAGKLIENPVNPVADGYIFLGWFTDETMKKEWNFATDIIQSDIMLYACWSKQADQNTGLTLCVQDIVAQTYTGSAVKPAVTVYAADGITRLKPNKDYSVTYKNNINADTKAFSPDNIPQGGIGETLGDTSQGFNSSLPYVIVKGKNNYRGEVYVNFHINPADISAAGEAGSGYTLKYTDQFDENAGKSAAVVTQFKYKNKGLKYNTDYTLEVKKLNAGAEPTPVSLTDKGQLWLSAGEYQLAITGTGNYKGQIIRTLYVADKTKLFKNAKVSCKGSVLNVTKEQLAAGVEAENLVVKLNNIELTRDTQYKVTCTNNHAIGTATVTVTPAEGSGFMGSKSVTFKIKGTSFSAGAFQQIKPADMSYTGKAVTQNDIKLISKDSGKELTYGEDYTVSYQNNIKKGTAKIIFTASPSSGYSGKFSKTFKITPLDLGMALGEEISINGAEKTNSGWKLSQDIPYQKGGATADDRISLQLKLTGAVLEAGNGKDYTVSYKNNKDVSNGAAYMILKGRGNYAGTVNVYFDITKASLSELFEEGRVTITSASIRVGYPYKMDWVDSEDHSQGKEPVELKDPDREFRPAITVKDGKTTLKNGTDYMVVGYSGNTRRDLEESDSMEVTIKGIGNYSGISGEDEEIQENVTVNRKTISGSTIRVEYQTEYTYTGEPIMPAISVECKVGTEVIEEDVLDKNGDPVYDANGDPKIRRKTVPVYESISEGADYIVEYSKNTAKGKGTIKIIGIGGFTGSASKSFKIVSKEIYNKPGQSGGSEDSPEKE